jgi:hypothetical protein
MSTLAEIEAAAKRLPPGQQQELIQRLISKEQPSQGEVSTSRSYRTRTHPGSVLPGIDPDKLGQVPEDF